MASSSLKRQLLPNKSLASYESLGMPPVHEVVLAADVHCEECQKRLATVISRVNVDTESIMVHVSEKKVILTRNSITNPSRRIPSCFPKSHFRASKILRLFTSLVTCQKFH